MSASGQDPETYPAVTLPKSPAVEQIEAVTEFVRIIAETTAERDRYRTALEPLVAALAAMSERGEQVPVDALDAAREALNPPAAPDPTCSACGGACMVGGDGESWVCRRCGAEWCVDHGPQYALDPPAAAEQVARQYDVPLEMLGPAGHSNAETSEPRACICTVSLQLAGSDRCDACGGWVS